MKNLLLLSLFVVFAVFNFTASYSQTTDSETDGIVCGFTIAEIDKEGGEKVFF